MHFCGAKRTSGSEKARLGDDLRNGQVPFKKPSQHSSQHTTSDKLTTPISNGQKLLSSYIMRSIVCGRRWKAVCTHLLEGDETP